jgi:hypothetical protein
MGGIASGFSQTFARSVRREPETFFEALQTWGLIPQAIHKEGVTNKWLYK